MGVIRKLLKNLTRVSEFFLPHSFYYGGYLEQTHY